MLFGCIWTCVHRLQIQIVIFSLIFVGISASIVGIFLIWWTMRVEVTCTWTTSETTGAREVYMDRKRERIQLFM